MAGFNIVQVNGVEPSDDGAIRAIVQAEELNPPTGFLRQQVAASASIPGATVIDLPYVIPNTKKIILYELRGGAASVELTGANPTNGVAIELWYSPTGVIGIGSILLGAVFSNGQSDTDRLYREFTGDGTAAIVLRADAFGVTARRAFVSWKGWVEP